MTAVVIARNQGKMLVADGNQYLLEAVRAGKEYYEKYQSTGRDISTPVAEIHALAMKRLQELERDKMMRYSLPIKYKLYTKGGEWKIRFLTRGGPGTFGLVKGTIEGGETAQDAAYREFEEETGFTIPAGGLVAVEGKPNVFVFNASDQQAIDILKAWSLMGRHGELYDLQWMPEGDVKARRAKNVPTREALAGGRRTRRRRLTRRTRRN